MPREVDFAVAGAGFTGLAAAAWLRRLAPDRSVAVFEAGRIGAGSSGHTGGLALAESAVGDLPGLGDVLRGFRRILADLDVECDLDLRGVYELAHNRALADSPVDWSDGGPLRVAGTVPGGSIDPGKLLSGLARAAHGSGAQIFEQASVEGIKFARPLEMTVAGTPVRANRLLVATNAMSLELGGLAGRAEPKFTLAAATAPLAETDFKALGLGERRPFYTVDLPYLWGRFLPNGAIVFGSGLVHLNDWRELNSLDVSKGQAALLMERLIARIRALHPVLRRVRIMHHWGGPMLVAREWRPVFSRHPGLPDAIVLGAYAGHGVALSSYLGCWAAEALLDRRDLPKWGTISD